MGMMPRFSFIDTLFNLVSGLGTAKDKSVHTKYAYNALSKVQLESAYRGDWMMQKIVDIPAQDSTRAWRDWQAETSDISVIEEAERELQLLARH